MRIEKKAVEQLDKYARENPNNPTVFQVLDKFTAGAANTLGQLMVASSNENVRLAAARDILDRAGYKPIERKDITSGGQVITPAGISDEKLTEMIDGFIKRAAIDVPARQVKPPEGTF